MPEHAPSMDVFVVVLFPSKMLRNKIWESMVVLPPPHPPQPPNTLGRADYRYFTESIEIS